MLGRAKTHRGKIHTKSSLRRKCTPLVLTAIAVFVLITVFFLTGISRGEAPGGDQQIQPDPEQPQHRFLEGHSLLTQSEAAEPEKYFHTKATPPEPFSDSSDSPQAKPKLGFYFQKDIPEQLLSSNTPAGILPQLQKVAKHKAAEGKGGKMGFYFAHDIPEEIKASGDGSQSAASANQQAASSGKTLKQQHSDSVQAQRPQPKQMSGRPLLDPLKMSPDPLRPQQKHFGKQQSGATSVESSETQPKVQQQTSTLGSDNMQASNAGAAEAHLVQPLRVSQGGGQQVANGLQAGTRDGQSGAEVHRKLARDLPQTKPPLGYYFAVPEGVKAAKTQLFQADPAAAAAEPASTKGPLGYYFSKDISDSAKRKGSWRARLLRSHLQPDAIPVNPF